MSHNILKTFCLKMFIIIVPHGLYRMNMSILCSPPDQCRTFFISDTLKWEKRPIDVGVGNKKRGPSTLPPLLPSSFLCRILSQSGHSLPQNDGLDKGCSVIGFSTGWSPLNVPILWGEKRVGLGHRLPSGQMWCQPQQPGLSCPAGQPRF